MKRVRVTVKAVGDKFQLTLSQGEVEFIDGAKSGWTQERQKQARALLARVYFLRPHHISWLIV